jgi:cell division protein FtsB
VYSRTLWAITWRKFKEQWLPGLVTGIIFLLLGAWLAWKISYNDTQTQIAGLERANDQLTKTNDQLKGTNDQLKEIALGLLSRFMSSRTKRLS